MKKLVMIVAVMLSMTTAFANENETKMDVYDMTTNIESLSKYLNLSKEQIEDVKSIHETFCQQMSQAKKAAGNRQGQAIEFAIKRNVRYMSLFLNHDQYKKYLRVLNATIVNRGLNDKYNA